MNQPATHENPRPRMLWGDAVEVNTLDHCLVVLGNERENFLNIEASSTTGMCRSVWKTDVISIWRMGEKIWERK